MPRANRYETMVKPYLTEIEDWIQGMSEADIATKLGVAYSTFQNYKNANSELKEALRRGKQDFSVDLKASLKKRAKGYWYTETKTKVTKAPNKEGDMVVVEETTETFTKYAPPDVGAIHLFLKNVDDSWRNDDAETMKMKKEKVEAEKAKSW